MRRRHAAMAAAIVAVGTSATAASTQRTSAPARTSADVRALDPYPVDEARLLERASRSQQRRELRLERIRLARARAARAARLHALAVLHREQAHARELARLARTGTGGVPAIWAALARCESGGDWHDTAGSYEGGVQFLNSTWLAYGGGRYAEHAYDATPMEQVTVARRVLAADGPSQWPVCGPRVGLTRENGR